MVIEWDTISCVCQQAQDIKAGDRRQEVDDQEDALLTS